MAQSWIEKQLMRLKELLQSLAITHPANSTESPDDDPYSVPQSFKIILPPDGALREELEKACKMYGRTLTELTIRAYMLVLIAAKAESEGMRMGVYSASEMPPDGTTIIVFNDGPIA